MQPPQGKARRLICALAWIAALVALCAVAGAPIYIT
jgi:hypothetical protein